MEQKNLGGIIYSNYKKENKSGEEFIKEHTFSYLISGQLTIIEGNQKKNFRDGDFALFRKNSLAKFFKRPTNGNPFVAVSIILDREILLSINKSQHFAGSVSTPQSVILAVQPDIFLKHYFESLLPYFDEQLPDQLIQNKKQEAVMLLLRNNPELEHVLFDFGIPGKINLESFMNKHFRYNVPLDKLAYLTGRSLASFKRDFVKVFNSSPSRWIQQQRLKEAHYLISEKKNKPSDVYLEVGFETLSHFSFAFKQFFGYNASTLDQHNAH